MASSVRRVVRAARLVRSVSHHDRRNIDHRGALTEVISPPGGGHASLVCLVKQATRLEEIRSGHSATLRSMPGKVRTAEELEQMSPAEQDAVFAASIVTDLNAVPSEFLEHVRSRAADRIARIDTPRSNER
jgi:hypothetical protein